jgi:hypothetical protein
MAKDARITGATLAERRALGKLEARVIARLTKSEEDQWRAGRDFDRIATKGLHHAGGFATLEAYADARFKQGYSTLARYRLVSGIFSLATTRKHGMTRLALGLAYIGATPEHERPRDLLRLVVRVPDGARVVKVPFAKASKAQLEKAVSHENGKPHAADDAVTKRAKRVVAKLQPLVAAPKGATHHAPKIRAYASPNERDKLRIDVVGIDEDDLARVLRALSGAKLS